MNSQMVDCPACWAGSEKCELCVGSGLVTPYTSRRWTEDERRRKRVDEVKTNVGVIAFIIAAFSALMVVLLIFSEGLRAIGWL